MVSPTAAPDRPVAAHPAHSSRPADPEWDAEAVAALRACEYARLDAGMLFDYAGPACTRTRSFANSRSCFAAASSATEGFVSKLGSSHGLLQIRVKYPVDGETWEKRGVVYDNAGVQRSAWARRRIGLGHRSGGA